MASISSSSFTPSLCTKPSANLTSLSSSSSIFFSCSSKTWGSFGVKVKNQPSPAKKKGFSCTSLFGLGVPELVVIAGVVALVFGPKKLPEVGRSIGKTVKSFQQAAKEFESEIKKDGEPLTDDSGEKATPISEEGKQGEAKLPNVKENA